MKQLTFILLILVFHWTWAQTDSVLTYEQFIQQVLNHHPLTHQADLAEVMGKAKRLKAYGGFEPKLEYSTSQKDFDDKNYYLLRSGQVKIPSWFGLSFQGGIDNNQGVYLNPENNTSLSDLWYAGVQLELGNGLFIDERRATLKKGKIAYEASQLKRKIMRNELVLEASTAYWNWQQAYLNNQVYVEAIKNAQERYRSTISMVKFGDKPAIDTVEVSIQLQNRQLSLIQTELVLQNARQKMEIYLWQEGFVPLEVNNAVPQLNAFDNMDVNTFYTQVLVDTFVQQHPYFVLNELQTKEKEVDLRLKKEQLKPTVSLKYNALTSDPGDVILPMNNYTWGAIISYPILSLKARGDIKLGKAELENQSLNTQWIAQKLNYELAASLNKFQAALRQFELMEANLANYKTLYQSEVKLFNAGESSLFMVNSREKSYIDAQVKRNEYFAKVSLLRNELDYQFMQVD